MRRRVLHKKIINGIQSNISDFTYYGLSSVTLEANVQDFCFNSDGTKIFAIYPTSSNSIRQYSLSVPFDVTTMSFESSYSLGYNGGRGIKIKPTNDQVYVWDTAYGMRVYNLALENDIATASLNVLNYYNNPSLRYGFDFNNDGTVLIISSSSSFIEQFVISTAYDFSTMTSDYVTEGVTTTLRTCSFVNFGNSILVGSSLSGFQKIEQRITLSPYNINGITTDSIDSIDLSSSYGTGGVFSAQYKPDNTSFYFLRGDRNIYQFNL